MVDNRTIPRSVEPSTQYLPVGKFLTIVNGYDRPIKYLAWPIVRITGTFSPAIYPLGFHRVPGTPVARGVEPNPAVATTTNTNSISVQFKAVPELGLGIDEDTKKNSYRWKVSFINNAGAESPLSSASEQVNWTTNASEFRYACAIEIPVGENDVVARRLYRTKNFSTDGGNDGSLYYYVTDIPNNNETLYIDSTPDLGLGTLAPGPTESIVFPSFNCRFTGLYKDCLFIDGGKSNDTVIYYSNGYDLEKRLQSEDRAHRIGQTKAVTYVDIIAEDTVDEKIVKALRNKINIASEVMGEELKEWI